MDSGAVNGFKTSCTEYHQLNLDLDNERFEAKRISVQEINLLFAFKSAVKKETVFSWISSLTDGSISAVCVLDRGFWKLNSNYGWVEYDCQTPNLEAERLSAFVGLISNTAFSQHVSVQGRDRLSSLESGIGQYFNNWVSYSNDQNG